MIHLSLGLTFSLRIIPFLIVDDPLCGSQWAVKGIGMREQWHSHDHCFGEKWNSKMNVQSLIKKDQAMIVNNCSFCCGRESPPSFATAARDLPQAFCLLVRGEVERLMNNSKMLFASISATLVPGIKAKTKFPFRVAYVSLFLIQYRGIF